VITGSLARPGVPQWPSFFSDEVQIDRLVEKVSAESKQRGGNVLTDLRTRDRFVLDLMDADLLVERIRGLGQLVEARKRHPGYFERRSVK